MTSAPIISVVVPAYNASRWIKETLDSVLAQTFRDYEVIVVDDGSTDNTADLIESYEGAVRCVRKANGGASSARNVGIRCSRGSWIAFVDADDLWLPFKLDLQVRMLEKYPDLAWFYSDAYIFESDTRCIRCLASENQRPYTGDILRQLLMYCFIPSPTPLVRRDVFDQAGYFSESPVTRIGEDWDLWLRIAAMYKVGYVHQPTAGIRQHKTSMIGSVDLGYYLNSKLTVVEEALQREPKRLQDLRKTAVANVLASTGEYMLARGARREARKVFREALMDNPSSLRSIFFFLLSFLPAWMLATLKKGRFRFQQIRRLGNIDEPTEHPCSDDLEL
jgi:glycosyltransferase involved in cell wall biosynthesis